MTRFVATLALALVAGLLPAAETPTLGLAGVFSDHAVLQRDQPLPIWGTAAPGAVVTVELGGHALEAVTGADGRWRLEAPPLTASVEPLTITVSSGGEELVVRDVLVGEVWLCSGQSNMAWGLNWGVDDGEREIAAADHPQIRLLQVAQTATAEPRADIEATWMVCSPATIPNFSAVAYFFGRELQQELGVPIGLVNASWGGTPAQSWTAYEVLAADPATAGYAQQFDAAMAAWPEVQARYEAQLADLPPAVERDDTGWEAPGHDAGDWETMSLPQNWERTGLKIDGTVWYRRTIELPAAAAGQPLTLSLGPIDDNDVTFWDGQEIGRTDGWNQNRIYTVPAEFVTPGRHVIAIQVVDTGGGGGLYGEPEQLVATPASGEPIPLAGEWHYRVAHSTAEEPRRPMGPGNPWLPSGLRKGMIAPLVPYAIRGAIWYQGESNAGRAWEYRTLFPAMIADWRRAWGRNFPFYFVQLASYKPIESEPTESTWAELRDAQLHTLRSVPDTGMAVTIDIGDAKNIHPGNKQDVGKRLALWALKRDYGHDIVSSGPIAAGAEVVDGSIRVSFDHLGGGLAARGGGELQGFAIAGADRRWVWARAEIDGDAVLVSSGEVPEPVAVRYGWQDNPSQANLVNAAGLPASPFRTDEWPAITDK